MRQAAKNPAEREFRRSCQIATGLSLALYVVCSQAALRMHGNPIGLVLSGFAGAAFFAELISVGLLTIRLRDEFQRTLLMRSFVWATLITMGLSTIWGFIELNSRGAVPHLHVIWIPLILVSITAAAKLLIFHRHKPDSE